MPPIVPSGANAAIQSYQSSADGEKASDAEQDSRGTLSGQNNTSGGDSFKPPSNGSSPENGQNGQNSQNSQNGQNSQNVPPPPPPSHTVRHPNTNANHEITMLKTRISELELVNDLYRTRIMELEAMEQAARLREILMRKRLDEVLHLQENRFNGETTLDSQRTQKTPAQQPSPTSLQLYGQRYLLPPIQNIKREHEGAEGPNKKLKLDA